MATETITRRIGATDRGWRPERLFGRDWRVAWLFIFPTVMLMGGLIAYPFLSAVWLSFNRVTGIRNFGFVGLDNYIDVWQDPFFLDSVRVTMIFTFTSVAVKLVIGIIAAILLNQRLRFRNVITGLILLPWIIPEVVTAMTWRSLYDPTFGGINQALLALGVIDKGLPWLAEWALPSVIIVNIWKGIPFFTITLLAGIKAIDPELYDAASVDGANAWQRFLFITLPGLRYVILVSGLLSTIWTFNAFGIVYLITSGGPGNATRLYSLLAYREAFGTLRYSTGVTIALTLAPALIVVILILGRYMMTNPGREGESKRGIGDYLALPFVLVFKAIVATFLFLNGLVENALSAIGKTLFRNVQVSGRTGRIITHTIAYVVVMILMLFEMMPFYWVFITSFKTELQITRIQSVFWPAPWTLDNINKLLFDTAFLHWLWNSVQVAAVSTAIAVIVSALGAYALTRLRWRGSGFVSNSILIAYLMPGALMFIPLYQIVTQLHLINTLGALIVTYPTFVLPFASWLLMGYYRSIPEELEEAAMIDGCTRVGAFFRIVLPLVRPALLAVALFAITQAWNEFLFAFTMTASDDVQTLPVGLSKMIVGDVFPWGPMMAASLLTAIPVVILYMSAQKFMIQGMTAGSVKG